MLSKKYILKLSRERETNLEKVYYEGYKKLIEHYIIYSLTRQVVQRGVTISYSNIKYLYCLVRLDSVLEDLDFEKVYEKWTDRISEDLKAEGFNVIKIIMTGNQKPVYEVLWN